jgi:demethylmenaquinone methyltransferase/2-methoxy-6-polyprenyl-1,4-benzoquinol methylase
VACGTGAVALELVRQYRCRVVGVDQSEEMLAVARRRVGSAIELRSARAESLPFDEGTFEALTFTYLLRYVDDPAAMMTELGRVVRPGGRIAMLEFFTPPNGLARVCWEGYVRAVLPLLGRAISPGWSEVGTFLGPSIRDFWACWPLERLLDAWNSAGIEDVHSRTLSLGGGVVVWGRRAS